MQLTMQQEAMRQERRKWRDAVDMDVDAVRRELELIRNDVLADLRKGEYDVAGNV